MKFYEKLANFSHPDLRQFPNPSLTYLGLVTFLSNSKASFQVHFFYKIFAAIERAAFSEKGVFLDTTRLCVNFA